MSKVLIVIDEIAAFADTCGYIMREFEVEVIGLARASQVLAIKEICGQEFLVVERWVEVDDDGKKERQELHRQPDLILCSPHPSFGDAMTLDAMVDGKFDIRFFLNPEEAPDFTRTHKIGREEMIFKSDSIIPFQQELKRALEIA